MKIEPWVLLKLSLDSLGIVDVNIVDADAWPQRRMIHHIIYLLEAFGVDILYDFSWEGGGPYSGESLDPYSTQSSLSNDLRKLFFENRNYYQKMIKDNNWHWSDEAIAKISQFEKLIGDKVKNDPDWGMMLAMVHFAARIFYDHHKSCGRRVGRLVRHTLKDNHPDLLSRLNVSQMLNLCQKHLNIPRSNKEGSNEKI